MDATYWHDVWEKRDIGFDQTEPNPLLKTYISRLPVEKNSRIFIPLCGKSVDAIWLYHQGYQVVGAELSPIAVKEFFEALNISPKIEEYADCTRYFSKNIEIFCGDIFKLSRSIIGKIDAVYDRAAIVAMPDEMRRSYAMQIHQITQNAPQLVLCYEFSNSDLQGPPFNVTHEHLKDAYLPYYTFNLIEEKSITSQKGNQFKECVWLLY